ncbi:MAG: hypothetical protein ACKO35_15460 [Planctomycetaceae bacterium]
MAGFFRWRPAGGTALVLSLLAVAVGLASFAVWFQWQQTRRCLTFYGSDAAWLIQRAPRVEVWERTSADDAGVAGIRRWDVTSARGLVHLRRGLVEDANLDWDRSDTRAIAADAWQFALAFFPESDPRGSPTVLLVERGDDGASLGVEGRPGRVGLGRLAVGIDRWWGTSRDEATPVAP